MSRRLDERAARVAKIRDRNTRLDAAHARHLEEAHARWRDGYLLPWRITMWLDMRGLYGPEVDAELGVPEPTVDQWEAGEVYPTWDQVLALANLVGLATPWPLTDGWGGGDLPTGLIFVCDRSRPSRSSVSRYDEGLVARFSREALADHRARLAALP